MQQQADLKPFLWFYALTFLLLAVIPICDALFIGEGLNFDTAAARASAATGLQWTSNLLIALRLALVEPSLLLVIYGSAVPAFAAIIVIACLRRQGKWRTFLARLNPFCGTELRTALRLYATIFAVLIAVLLTVLWIRNATGGNYTITGSAFGLTIVPSVLAIAFLDQGAVLEELGWRGFATPELQERMMTPLTAAVVIGICWGLWHLPRDITTGVIERLGVMTYLSLYLPAFLTGTVAVSVIASYFMNQMGGSLIPAIVVHGITNDAVGLSGTASIVDALTPYHQATKNLPLAALAMALIVLSGYSLGRLDTGREEKA